MIIIVCTYLMLNWVESMFIVLKLNIWIIFVLIAFYRNNSLLIYSAKARVSDTRGQRTFENTVYMIVEEGHVKHEDEDPPVDMNAEVADSGLAIRVEA